MSPESNLDTLLDRASMLKAVRDFFDKRHVIEVDTPLLSLGAPIDPYIDILETTPFPGQTAYLHSSPEYGMKKLLAKGLSNIYQLSHVYRQGESSPRHQVEFTMIEWYRHPFSFEALLQETKDLISLFLGHLPYEIVRYDALFEQFLGIHPLVISLDALSRYCQDYGLYIDSDDRDVYLSFLWDRIEPSLGDSKLTFVTHFPASQAALSKTFKENSSDYAARFECYHQGLELANGYHELTNPLEQRNRLIKQQAIRISLNKPPLAIDEKFLDALHHLHGKDYYGVAVGFDRLMMLRHQASHIEQVIPLGLE